jgi:hypothetical protein
VLHASFTGHHVALIVASAMYVLRYALQFAVSVVTYETMVNELSSVLPPIEEKQ